MGSKRDTLAENTMDLQLLYWKNSGEKTNSVNQIAIHSSAIENCGIGALVKNTHR